MKHEDIHEVSDPHQLALAHPVDHGVPEIRVIKGCPTDAEVAAVVTVLAGLGGTAAPGPEELNLWGHPVDKLRYTFASWQSVTLRDRTHVRR